MHLTILLASALGVAALPAAQCLPIPDRIAALPAAQRADAFVIVVGAELLEVPWEDVLSASDLVIEGTVQQVRTYLSNDRCTVLTDYAVTILTVHRGTLQTPTKPGAAPPLTITTVGGEMIVDGVRVVVRYDQLRPFTSGQHVLLMLTRRARGSEITYEIAKGVYGAFAVENGKVKHLLTSAGSARFDDLDKPAFIAKVKQQ